MFCPVVFSVIGEGGVSAPMAHPVDPPQGSRVGPT